MIQIPIFQAVSSDFFQEIDLGGQLVQLRMTYNIRVGFFFLTFTDQDGTSLSSIKIVPTWPLLNQVKSLLNFSGDLVVIKTDADAGDLITYDNFGNGWDLFYLTEAELATWKVENGLTASN